MSEHEPGTRYVLQLANGETWEITTCAACACVVPNGDWQTHADWAATLTLRTESP